ncbi:MAG TPA: efflux RND transporter permease subunit [Candidatus Dormibacteraeota bacterium]|nr:efflux RND transporter permease subunit [Candidatus Dormibacteraeota bacterium]
MNAGEFSVRNNRIIIVAAVFVFLGGVMAYVNLGRLEDPEFTIKEALVITPYPGASAEEVAQEVTNPIESALQQLGQLERVESESTRGRSVVSAIIKDRFHADAIPQVWDELRRKINDVQSRLPPAVRGRSVVVDDFGDVYGVFLAITGDGFTQAELRRYAEFLRRELQTVPDVKKVDLFAEQQEVVYLEMSRQRLAQLGIDEERIYAQLQARNVAADGGRVRVGDAFLPIDPQGGFGSADDMLDLVIGAGGAGPQLTLRDVATLVRADEDPPRRLLRFDGKPGIGLGISTVRGGNVVTMGEAVQRKLDALRAQQPLGIEIGEINFQPTAVTVATGDFVFNLIKAVTIVFVLLLIAMGPRAGLSVGVVLGFTIVASLLIMYFRGGILLERISLGAFIIALCMLTDNAIVITESIKVGIESGKDKLGVIRDAIAHNQWPLFGATAIAIVAFAAIGLSEDNTGEYTRSLFYVIAISLTLSWVASITLTPLLGYALFKPRAGGDRDEDPYRGAFFQGYRRLLVLSLRFRWAVLVIALGLFVAAVYGFGRLPQNFFPPATRPQFLVDAFLPAGTHIRDSEAFAESVEQFLMEQPDVTHVTSFVGGGGLRFLLVYSPERENRAFVQFLVEVDDEEKIDDLLPKVQAYLEQNYPNANAVAKKFLLGPGKGGRIQARFSGADPATLRALADQAEKILADDGGAIGVRDDWREPEMVIQPDLREVQARRNGITRVEVAAALETGFQGRVVGFYREPGIARGGIFPQETRLLPIVARPPEAERRAVDAIYSMQIWSPVAGRMIPLSQVTSGIEMGWENPVIMRRDRLPTITVHADPRAGLPSALFNRVREQIEAIPLPPGYAFAWGGEHEDSTRARGALAQSIPMVLLLMVFIVVCLFNSVRTTVVIVGAVPLAIIGVTGGLLLTGRPFGFMALLGVLSLGGEQIKNSVVLLEELYLDLGRGKPPYQAMLDAAVARLRPVLLVAVTTVLGMIPLVNDAFFGAMAVTIMFGLSFACVLTMIVVPVMYAIAYRIEETPATGR